jgi:hypothetical protein
LEKNSILFINVKPKVDFSIVVWVDFPLGGVSIMKKVMAAHVGVSIFNTLAF